jgi:transposase
LERLVRDRNTPQKVVWRGRIVLFASEGLTAEAIAVAVGKSLLTVRRRRHRFVAKGVDGLLKDATRPSRVKPLVPEKERLEIRPLTSSVACESQATPRKEQP